MVSGFFSAILMVALVSIIGWLVVLLKKARSLPQELANRASARKLADSEMEERLYESVRQEIESGEIRSGLWTKAEATANSSDKTEIRAKYIQLRFEQLEAQNQLSQNQPEEKISGPIPAAQKTKKDIENRDETRIQKAELAVVWFVISVSIVAFLIFMIIAMVG